MEIKDLAGLSEPLKKLVETIFNGIGKIFESRYIKSIAKAESFKRDLELKDKVKEINEISNVLKDKEIVNINYNTDSLSLDNKPILERTYNRLLHQEIERTNNIDNIVIKVIEKLKDEEKVSDDPVNKDWTKRFFNIAQDISDEYMQELWASILAGEIKQPNSFSLRTLETLKNMSKEEAELFVKVAELSFFTLDNQYYLFNNIDIFKSYGIRYIDLVMLSDIGLIGLRDNEGIPYISNKEIQILNSNFIFIIESGYKKYENKVFIKGFIFTNVGNELMNLIDNKSTNNDCFIDNIKEIKNILGSDIKCKLQKIENIDLKNARCDIVNIHENLINDI